MAKNKKIKQKTSNKNMSEIAMFIEGYKKQLSERQIELLNSFDNPDYKLFGVDHSINADSTYGCSNLINVAKFTFVCERVKNELTITF